MPKDPLIISASDGIVVLGSTLSREQATAAFGVADKTAAADRNADYVAHVEARVRLSGDVARIVGAQEVSGAQFTVDQIDAKLAKARSDQAARSPAYRTSRSKPPSRISPVMASVTP